MPETLEIATKAAKTAGKFLKQSVGNIKEIRQKYGQEKNLVTEIDKKSEKMIIEMVRTSFPDHSILAEEGGDGSESRPAEFKWIIDPLDGTTNFTHGFPVFCVSIGIEVEGKLQYGVIYDPNFDELFTAERGKGAYLNGNRVKVSKVNSLKQGLLVTGFPYNIVENPDHAVEHFTNFLMKAQAVRRMGSAALDLAYLACGRFDGFWEVALHPWDVAAGVLMVEEAGGRITDFSGAPYSIYNKQLLSSNGLVHDEMKTVLASAG
jgi:myo-inositol-1(or 4)-monophosphatase